MEEAATVLLRNETVTLHTSFFHLLPIFLYSFVSTNKIIEQQKINMETNKDKIEHIQTAIQQLIQSHDSHRITSSEPHLIDHDYHHDDDNRQLLNKLLSQLEALKDDSLVDPSEPSETKDVPWGKLSEVKTTGKNVVGTSEIESNSGARGEDVVKELKKLEKQNRITHWLLSGLILLTVAWQLSEVSLLLKLKEGLTHPLKSLGSMVAGVVKRPRAIELDMPQLPLPTKKNVDDTLNHLELPHFSMSDLINEEQK